MNNHPPKYFLRFFRWFCHPRLQKPIEGDLMELYQERIKELGKRRADRKFRRDVLLLFRPSIIKPADGTYRLNNYGMLRNYLKVGVRNLVKDKTFSVINIFGLCAALTAAFTIFSYVRLEFRTDIFLDKEAEIFRLVREVEDINASYQSPTLAAPFKSELQDVLRLDSSDILRVYREDELITFDGRSFFEKNVLFADRNFFEIFEYPFLFGDQGSALDKPNSVVLSRETAKKYFGDTNPVGKTIEPDGKTVLEVTGVLDEINEKSHLEIDLVVSMSAVGYSSDFLSSNREVHLFSYYIRHKGKPQPLNLQGAREKISLWWQPLADIYFEQDMQYDIAQHGNRPLLKSLGIVGILIILIAGANFLNLTLSSSLRKVKDIVVRKTIGSTRNSEIAKLLVEVYISVFIAFALALPASMYLGQTLQLKTIYLRGLLEQYLILKLFGISLLLTFLFALYPAIVISSINSSGLVNRIKVVKTVFLQNALLTFQFSAAMVLVVMSLVITQQFDYLQSKKLGLNPDQILYFSSNNKHSWKNKDRIGEQVAALNGVKDVAMIYGGLPELPAESASFEVGTDGSKLLFKTAFASLNIAEVLELEIVDGRSFEKELRSDKNNTVLLNETAAKLFGWPTQSVIGRSIKNTDGMFDNKLKIIGVVRDYHFESYRNAIDPLVIASADWEETFVVKLSANNYQETINQIEAIWRSLVPRYPFTFRFLDETFQRLQEQDTKQRKMLYLFSILSILLAVMGVLGLSAHFLQTKRKEIAIRNVLGASRTNLVYLVSSNYFKLLTLGGILCIPIAGYFANQWLSDFSYRIGMPSDAYVISIASITLLILAVVSLQTLKSTSSQPIRELNSE